MCVCAFLISFFFFLTYFYFLLELQTNLRWRLFLRFTIFNKTLIKYFRLIGSLPFRIFISVQQLMDDFAGDFTFLKYTRIYAIGFLKIDAEILQFCLFCLKKKNQNEHSSHSIKSLKTQPDQDYQYYYRGHSVSIAKEMPFYGKWSTQPFGLWLLSIEFVQWPVVRAILHMCMLCYYNVLTAGI